MSALLRKALRSSFLSSVSPRQRHFCSLINSSTLITKTLQTPSKPSLFLSFRFASSAKSVKAEDRLKRILEAEIIHEEESGVLDEKSDTPKGFPFEIIDNPGEQTITLKRDFEGESIQVEVHKPDLAEEEEEEDDDNESGDDDEESSSQLNISLIVKIAKGEGTSLEFCCTACSTHITVDSMQMKRPEVSPDQIAYEGPDFSDLDEQLQKAFYKYLDVRGINSSLTDFLQDYMMNKDGREYLGWLKNMKKFIET
ncbi:uncharacterized protein At2g39795, mitochondrial-like [Tasmannia lanceolata]|uniref:uncharacterized protein At2g39795, mitochondrial-like n=1 Tax=Tasmannia lanceolata TaxID=3420 RepID=UPI0040641239